MSKSFGIAHRSTKSFHIGHTEASEHSFGASHISGEHASIGKAESAIEKMFEGAKNYFFWRGIFGGHKAEPPQITAEQIQQYKASLQNANCEQAQNGQQNDGNCTVQPDEGNSLK